MSTTISSKVIDFRFEGANLDAGAWLAKVRVPLGWALGVTAILTAVPTALSLSLGFGLALAGEMVRVWAAGHLHKDRKLATSGPYRWTRNPLYFGTLFVGSGFALATGRLGWVFVFGVLFVVVYAPVMRREARRLATAFSTYEGYAARVPLFWPRRGVGDSGDSGAGKTAFSWKQVRANREHITLLGLLAVVVILATRLWGIW